MSPIQRPPGRGYRPLGTQRDSLRVEQTGLKRNLIIFIVLIIAVISILLWMSWDTLF